MAMASFGLWRTDALVLSRLRPLILMLEVFANGRLQGASSRSAGGTDAARQVG